MRALVVDPGSASMLRMAEVPEPEPRPDETVVAVAHVGLNRGELTPGVWPAGHVHGHDASGVVVAPAADGTGPPAGTAVVLGLTPHAWAQRVAAPVRALAPVPAGVELADAAALPVAGVAALRVMRTRALLGRRALVTGASGGVGRFAVQLAAHAGAHVTAVSARTAGLREIGADVVVADPHDVPAGVDLVLDTVGGPGLAALWALLGPGGTLHVVGHASAAPTTFGPGALFSLGAPRSITTGGGGDDRVADELATLLALLAAGRIEAGIGWRGDWSEVDDAVAALRAREVPGKVVLDVA